MGAQELLQNGDAETGTLAGWTGTAPVKAVTSQAELSGVVLPYQGSFFFTFAGTAAAGASMTQKGTAGLTPGALFVLRGRVQVEFDDPGEALLRFYANDVLVGSASTGPMQPATGTWVPFALSAVVPPSDRWEVELKGSLVTGTFVNVFWDALSLSACGQTVGASESVRLGSPPNPSALLFGVTSAPVIGHVWDPVVDHAAFAPSALADVLGLTLGPINVPLPPYGTLLCNPSVVLATQTVPAGTPFGIPVPLDCALAGLALCAQGASVLPSGAIQLTNALDVMIGTF